MLWYELRLATAMIEKYGLVKPLVEVGGQDKPCIEDYERAMATGDQNARFISLPQRPFDHIDPEYTILNPEKGDPYIENLPDKYTEEFGTILCLSVLEHVNNPFEVFLALKKILKPEGMLVVSTVFEYPYHPGPNDFWRFSPECLRYLVEQANLIVLEYGWGEDVEADQGVISVQDQKPMIVKSSYIVTAKTLRQELETKLYFPIPEPIPDERFKEWK